MRSMIAACLLLVLLAGSIHAQETTTTTVEEPTTTTTTTTVPASTTTTTLSTDQNIQAIKDYCKTIADAVPARTVSLDTLVFLNHATAALLVFNLAFIIIQLFRWGKHS